jgi:predicted dehydrogenase
MKTVHWGIIGCGDVTEVKSGPALQNAGNSELVAVMRRNDAKAKNYAERHGVSRWYDNADSLINDPEVDAVYIATPPDSHMEYALAVAKAGKPVYVEKPMARNYAECQTMIQTCKEAGVPLFVAYYRRALPRFLKIKELIDSGAIGDVQLASITFRQPPPIIADPNNIPWRYIPEIAGGGLYADLASHMLDIFDFLLGPIRSVEGSASNRGGLYPAEDIVSGSFVFESGVHGVGSWCFTSFDECDFNEIIGTKGQISYSCFGESPITLLTDQGTENFDIGNPAYIQQPLIQTVVNDLIGIEKCVSTGDTAARTSWVMDQMLTNFYP